MVMQPLFTPKNLYGGLAWYDASITPVGAVSSWTDQFGNGNAATQGTGGQQPICTANQQNGLSTLLFVGSSSQTLVLPSALYPFPQGAGTVFTVANSTNNSAAGVVYRFATGGNSGQGKILFGNNNNTGSTTQITFANGNGLVGVQGAGTNTAYQVITGYHLGTSEQITINSSTSSDNSGGNGSGVASGYIGSNNNATLFLTGGIGELIFYSRALSSTEITAVQSYLKQKWGTA